MAKYLYNEQVRKRLLFFNEGSIDFEIVNVRFSGQADGASNFHLVGAEDYTINDYANSENDDLNELKNAIQAVTGATSIQANELISELGIIPDPEGGKYNIPGALALIIFDNSNLITWSTKHYPPVIVVDSSATQESYIVNPPPGLAHQNNESMIFDLEPDEDIIVAGHNNLDPYKKIKFSRINTQTKETYDYLIQDNRGFIVNPYYQSFQKSYLDGVWDFVAQTIKGNFNWVDTNYIKKQKSRIVPAGSGAYVDIYYDGLVDQSEFEKSVYSFYSVTVDSITVSDTLIFDVRYLDGQTSKSDIKYVDVSVELFLTP